MSFDTYLGAQWIAVAVLNVVHDLNVIPANDSCQSVSPFDTRQLHLLDVHPHAVKLLPRLFELRNVSDCETVRVLLEEINVQLLLWLQALELFNVFHQAMHLLHNGANLLREFGRECDVRVLLRVEVVVNHRVVIVQLLRHVCNVLGELFCDCIALHCTLPHLVVAVTC
jgi:hypothetical protein